MEIIGDRRERTALMISERSIPCRQVEVGVTELALDDVDCDTLAGQLDGVGVAELMRSEPPSHACDGGELAQFGARGGG